ncbi:MAG: DMT family transporter [Rhodospirillales bacterium]|nr:DMT family transporter [Rhodospirillales bacterium]
MQRPTSDVSARLLLVLATLFWGMDIVVGRVALARISPMALLFWTWVIALIVVLPFGLAGLRDQFAVVVRHWRWITGLALLSVSISPGFFYAGLGLTSAINAALIVAMGPATVPAVAWLVDRTPLGARQVLGFALATLGVVTVVTMGDLQIITTLRFNLGDIFVVLAMLSWSLYSVLLPRREINLKPVSFLTIVITIGALALVPVAIVDAMNGPGFVIDAELTAAMLYIGIFPAVLSFLFWNRAVGILGPTAAGIYLNLTPVFAIGMAWLFLSEPLYAYHGVGIALVLAGVHLANRPSQS